MYQEIYSNINSRKLCVVSQPSSFCKICLMSNLHSSNLQHRVWIWQSHLLMPWQPAWQTFETPPVLAWSACAYSDGREFDTMMSWSINWSVNQSETFNIVPISTKMVHRRCETLKWQQLSYACSIRYRCFYQFLKNINSLSNFDTVLEDCSTLFRDRNKKKNNQQTSHLLRQMHSVFPARRRVPRLM